MLARFKTLNKGVLRILWSVCVILCALVMLLWAAIIEDALSSPYTPDDALLLYVGLGLLSIFGTFIGYWLATRWIIWIIDGFMKPNDSPRDPEES